MADTPFAHNIQPGQRVRLIQQVAREGRPLVSEVTGTVVRSRQQKTGSWYAHAKDDKLWLDRLELRLDDGEVVVCNVDAYTRIEVLPEEAAPTESSEASG